VDAEVTGRELDKAVARELSTLRAEAAEQAAKHLVMSGRLLDEDPEQAYQHALAARCCGPRVAVIREAVGVAAYTAGHWTEALAELRAARRISGDDEHWPMMADCERALGRPEKALAMAAAPEVKKLSKASLIEMRIVAAGARTDLGQLEAAVVTLQTADLNTTGPAWAPRLRFAYAAALGAAGRHEEAREWYVRAAEVDPEGETDAAERLQELDGIRFYEDDDADESAPIDEPTTVTGPTASAMNEAVEHDAAPVEVTDPVEQDAAPVAVTGPVGTDAALVEVTGPVGTDAASVVVTESVGTDAASFVDTEPVAVTESVECDASPAVDTAVDTEPVAVTESVESAASPVVDTEPVAVTESVESAASPVVDTEPVAVTEPAVEAVPAAAAETTPAARQLEFLEVTAAAVTPPPPPPIGTLLFLDAGLPAPDPEEDDES
jgi:hypothetical protein